MNVRTPWIVTVLGLFVGPAFAGCGSCEKGSKDAKRGHEHSHAHAKATINEPAPGFGLKDLTGKEHKLADLKGKIVVLEWTNHMCPFVRNHQAELKTTQKTFAKFKDKQVAWLAINSSHFCNEKLGEIKEWAKDTQLPYPVLLDPDGKVGRIYGAKTTPHMFVIDRKGVLAYSGAIDDDIYGDKETKRNYVEEAVSALVSGSTVPVATTKPYGCSVKYKN